MTAEEFDIIYEEKIEAATKKLPSPYVFPMPIIEIHAVISDPSILTPFYGDPLSHTTDIVKFLFEKKRKSNGELVWVRKTAKCTV